MIADLLSGWLGLLVLVLAGSCALAADALRQGGGTRARRPRQDRAVGWLTGLAVGLTALGAVATLVRFAVLA